MRLLRKGSRGEDVQKWEHFLVGLGLLKVADGVFDEYTRQASMAFQKMAQLKPDGLIGNGSYGKAMQMGFELVIDDAPDTDESSANWPPPPNFRTWSKDATAENLRKIEFVPAAS